VRAIMRKMAEVVDRQNAGDPAYRRWRRASTGSPSPRPAIWCSKGREQPSGYTEPVLHARRLEWKAA
jgi:malate synthase